MSWVALALGFRHINWIPEQINFSEIISRAQNHSAVRPTTAVYVSAVNSRENTSRRPAQGAGPCGPVDVSR